MPETQHEHEASQMSDIELVIARLGLSSADVRSVPPADVASLVQAVEQMPGPVGNHALRVRADVLAMIANMRHEVGVCIDAIGIASIFHDIGKCAISPEILDKPGPLTPNEMERVQQHSLIGHDVVRRLAGDSNVAVIVLHHHEWWDGTGYPGRLRATEIPFGSRLIAVADAFDAMTTDRPYRQAMSPDMAKNELVRCAGTQFDPAVVDAFLEVLTGFPALDRSNA